MKLNKTDEVITHGRKDTSPNPFLETETLEALKTGDTFRIDVDTKKGEKAHTIVNKMRAAADTVGMRVSVKLDEGVTKLADATTFRVKWSVRKPKDETKSEGKGK